MSQSESPTQLKEARPQAILHRPLDVVCVCVRAAGGQDGFDGVQLLAEAVREEEHEDPHG